MDEKFLNYYIEHLTNNVKDLRMQEVNFLVNARIMNETLVEKNDEINRLIQQIQEQIELSTDLSTKTSSLNKLENELAEARQQLSHLDTFRNELLKAHDNLADSTRHAHELKNSSEMLKVELNQKDDIINSLRLNASQLGSKNSDLIFQNNILRDKIAELEINIKELLKPKEIEIVKKKVKAREPQDLFNAKLGKIDTTKGKEINDF